MIVSLQKTEATSLNNPPGTATIFADSAECDPAGDRDHSGRKLRNRIIVANIVAWIVIAVAIRLIF